MEIRSAAPTSGVLGELFPGLMGVTAIGSAVKGVKIGPNAGVLGVRKGPDSAVLGDRMAPTTGDGMNLIFWIMILAAASLVAGKIIHDDKKRRKNAVTK